MSKRAARRAKGRLRGLLDIRRRDTVKCLMTLKQTVRWSWTEVYETVMEEIGKHNFPPMEQWDHDHCQEVMAACARLNAVYNAAEEITKCEVEIAYSDAINHPGNH